MVITKFISTLPDCDYELTVDSFDETVFINLKDRTNETIGAWTFLDIRTAIKFSKELRRVISEVKIRWR